MVTIQLLRRMSRGAFDVIQEMQDEFDDEEDRNYLSCILLPFSSSEK